MTKNAPNSKGTQRVASDHLSIEDGTLTPVTPWKMLSEVSSVGPSGFMRILTRSYILPDGRFSDWDLLDGKQTVAVLAFTPELKIVLARQYRPGPNLVLNEMPGGAVDPGEQPAEAAIRELLEETGYVGEVEVLGSTWLSASATTQRFVAIVRDCHQIDGPRPTGDEFCGPVLVNLADFRSQLRLGALTDVDLGYLALDLLGLL
jgi:ADP-ribose pyrophosphatase